MLEIERKFLMDGFPIGLEIISEIEIEQGYISTEPEVRIRRAVNKRTGDAKCRITIKGDGDLTRTEIETVIDEGFYYDVVDFLGVSMITKDYKKYRLGEWKLEVACVDEGTEREFFYGEIEFPTEEDARAFEPPKYLGREITFSEDHKMKNYWKRTRG